MPDYSDHLAELEEFLEVVDQWLEEPDPELLSAQVEYATAFRARMRRVVGSRLECVECGKQSEWTARGWRVYLTDDEEAVAYCPDCAEAEFGNGS